MQRIWSAGLNSKDEGRAEDERSDEVFVVHDPVYYNTGGDPWGEGL